MRHAIGIELNERKSGSGMVATDNIIFRETIAAFLTHYCKPAKPIDPENLLAFNGSGSAVEALGEMLAEPGDGFLIPAPFYGGFKSDLQMRFNVIAYPVTLSSEPAPGETVPFELTVERIEKAFNDAKKKGIAIRALLLCNPNNPFGCIYSDKLVKDCLQFAHKHKIHIIVDELYLLSIFHEGSSMNSVLSYTDIPDPERFHFIWGFSKDFAVSGFRCGVLYTQNKDLKAALYNTMYFQTVSTVTQHVLMNLIKDLDWVDRVYVPASHKRLRESNKIVCEFLQKADIPHLECKAGFFLWADFRKFLKSQTFEDEWELFEYFMDNKLYISPSVAFTCNEPGWFRIIFAEDPKILQIAMERLLKVVQKRREELSKHQNETKTQ
ncbi:probable inactive 1-aminocyclopropane-1-carboxylate synthase-like protein 2 [Actinia tenebrosa]|uniref:Probable inactive 1-aminocyclopropane-1-carboxylate synthase-like protein 2 n=1 Tax=Actinia tenebrosa TaxID=6105 RepID=A0A6P8JCK1_ACTTE|nr:probable inactive 1-aminocyclopropane-1-carboxylate synthase-like protein 2 [Actinia tenebrosa]